MAYFPGMEYARGVALNDSHHWGWIIIVGIIVISAVTYFFTVNRPDITNNAKGSIPISYDTKHYSLVDLNPCGAIFRVNGEDLKKTKK